MMKEDIYMDAATFPGNDTRSRDNYDRGRKDEPFALEAKLNNNSTRFPALVRISWLI